MDLTALFCHIDDFWQAFQPVWEQQLLASGERQRQRRTQLSMSEIMTLVILFHQSGFRTFKAFYCHYVCQYLGRAFPGLVSYQRFVELQSRAVVPLAAYLQTRYGKSRGIAFIDATSIAVCHNRRIPSHRVFHDLAARGKTSIGWFYGFKVHLVVNDQGELLAVAITPANRDDRKPVPQLTRDLVGKLFGDKGYISQRLFEELFERGLELITTLRRNMKPRLVAVADKLLLRKRALIESINDQLKNISQIEHSRHRSFKNFFVNLLAGLIAYTLQPTKPSLHFEDQDLALMTVC
jgi:IS5 family transposase